MNADAKWSGHEPRSTTAERWSVLRRFTINEHRKIFGLTAGIENLDQDDTFIEQFPHPLREELEVTGCRRLD